MDKKKVRYKQMETLVTGVLCADAIIFLAYLIFAAFGLTALKIISVVFCVLISGLILYYLFITRELLRKRSLWMSLAAACIIVCILFSLILNFPAPPYQIPVA